MSTAQTVKRKLHAEHVRADKEKARADKLAEELQTAGEQQGLLESLLMRAREECQKLRIMVADQEEDGMGVAQSRAEMQLRSLQKQLAWSRGEGETVRRRLAELQRELAAAQLRCQELSRAPDEEYAHEQFAERERVLEEEVWRLRSAVSTLEADGQSAAKAMAQRAAQLEQDAADFRTEAARHTQEATASGMRAAAAEARVTQLTEQLSRLEGEQAVELAALCAQHEEVLDALQWQYQQELQARVPELEVLEARLLEAAAETQAAAEELPRSNKAGSASDKDELDGADTMELDVEMGLGQCDDHSEVAALQERVRFLEQRCLSLQAQLDSCPIVFQPGPKGAAAAPALVCTSRVCSLLGPRAGKLVLWLGCAPERAIKGFTQQLIHNNVWMWVCYIHLLALYAILASGYVQFEASVRVPLP